MFYKQTDRLYPSKKFLFVPLFFLLFTFLFLHPFAYATGGAFPYTKHGGGTTDGLTPCAGGVNRGLGTDYGGDCTTAATTKAYHSGNPEAGTYMSGECNHCHELHASFGGSEPPPSSGGDAGPAPYLLMKEYGTTLNYSNLCWYCHENISNINGSGSPLTMGRWSFYQGKTVYTASSHYNSPSFYWPGTGETSSSMPKLIWPRKDRFGLVSGNKGSCLNCHTPHGIKATDAANAYDITSQDGSGGVPAAAQTTASNPSVMSDYMIPRQLISWEETLCERCHDVSGPAIDIQSEINKRGSYTGSGTTDSQGGSGHPVDYTSLAGRHTVKETIPLGKQTTAGDLKHVECYDCHNPHAVKTPTGGLGDGDGGRIKGMKYIDINGILQDPAAGARQPYIHEICFKCHGNSYSDFFESNKIFPTNTVYRPSGLSNKRFEFDPNSSSSGTGYGPNQSYNSAYHPVSSAGRNTTVAMCLSLQQSGAFPTLDCSSSAGAKTSLQNLTINCTDCHNTNATGGVLGPVTESNLRLTDKPSNYTGISPVGPHGSMIATPSLNFNGTSDNGDRSILRDYYFTGTIPQGTRPFNSALSRDEFKNRFKLCFNCHDYRPFYGYNDDSSENTDTNFAGIIYDRNQTKVYNFHYLHINGGMSGVSWFTTWEACMTCHYNIHSNVQATNTCYGGCGTNMSIPSDGDTHLVNFAPDVVLSMGGFSGPTWGYGKNSSDPPSLQWRMRCAVTCHGETMAGYGYGCSHSRTSNGVTTDTCSDY